MKTLLFITSFSLSVFLIHGCGQTPTEKRALPEHDALLSAVENVDTAEYDLPAIIARDTLRAICSYSSTSYFVYRGQTMGFEYELLQRLASKLGVGLKIVIADDLDEMQRLLISGAGDVIAHGLTITKNRKAHLAFTQSYAQTNQVLVQRKPVDWEKLKAHQLEKKLIRNPVKLLGKTIVVRKESAFYDRLLNLEDELGGDIDIQEAPAGMTMEGIIKAVDEGEYTFTLADQNIARINQTYYHDLDIETPVSFPQRLAWAVRKNAPELLAYVNQWLQEEQDQTDYYVIYNKYFKNKKAFLRRQESDYFSLTAGNISPFDSLLQQHAEQLQWDWRLLAAQVYQESRFDPKTASWAGALGLMQLMPATAQQWGVKDATKPQANLAAGTKHLAYLKKFWEKIPDPKERLKFVLASYNAGQGHIQDACRLAEKFGKNPAIWTGHVDEFILKKADPTYFQDEVVKYGYCRGTEPYNYVRDILVRFDRYQQVIDEV